jgi:hypothetical protein
MRLIAPSVRFGHAMKPTGCRAGQGHRRADLIIVISHFTTVEQKNLDMTLC